MRLNNLLNQFMGTSEGSANQVEGKSNGFGQTVSNLTSNIPGGLVGGVAAGGIMAMLMGNKSARKIAGKAATYGGAAMLGGLALKAYQNWQGNRQSTEAGLFTHQAANDPAAFHQQAVTQQEHQQVDAELILIKAMIAAARADGHIDPIEQQRIFSAVEKTTLSSGQKGVIFDYLQKDISIQELTSELNSMELKAEVYLASCLVIDADHPAERAHLDKLAIALQLPAELSEQLELQAHQALAVAA